MTWLGRCLVPSPRRLQGRRWCGRASCRGCTASCPSGPSGGRPDHSTDTPGPATDIYQYCFVRVEWPCKFLRVQFQNIGKISWARGKVFIFLKSQGPYIFFHFLENLLIPSFNRYFKKNRQKTIRDLKKFKYRYFCSPSKISNGQYFKGVFKDSGL